MNANQNPKPVSIRPSITFVFYLVLTSWLLLSVSGIFQWGKLLSPAHAGFFHEDLDTFDEVLSLIEEKYVYPPNFKSIFTSAIDGMAKSVDPEKKILTATPESLSKNESSITFQLDYSRKHNIAVLKKTYNFLLAEFKDNTNKITLEKAAINGMINALDPYSQYLDKDAFDRAVKDTEGKYGGLGMVISMKDYKLVVVKTMRNSPAERAGILPNDIITKVDTQDIKGLQIHELADKLRGLPNTKVGVTLLRPSDNKEREFNLTREIISVETVTYKSLANQTGYIKISGFSKHTEEQLNDAFDKIRAEKIKSIILDLRDNPGGLLEQSVKIASHFLLQDRLIVYTQGRQKNDRYEYLSKYHDSLNNMPIVVLINHYSASASEIVAGSLQDLDQALLVGENSYGKGSVQTIYRLSDGSGLRLTTSKYYTPSGIDITAHGISPDIEIVRDLPENDKNSKSKEPKQIKQPRPNFSQIHLKELELAKLLKEQGITTDKNAEGENDPLVLFSALILKDKTIINKKRTMEKAREIAANILY